MQIICRFPIHRYAKSQRVRRLPAFIRRRFLETGVYELMAPWSLNMQITGSSPDWLSLDSTFEKNNPDKPSSLRKCRHSNRGNFSKCNFWIISRQDMLIKKKSTFHLPKVLKIPSREWINELLSEGCLSVSSLLFLDHMLLFSFVSVRAWSRLSLLI